MPNCLFQWVLKCLGVQLSCFRQNIHILILAKLVTMCEKGVLLYTGKKNNAPDMYNM